MRELFITHIDSERTWRGGQQSLLTLAHGLRDRGHQQVIVCPEGSALWQRAAAQGFATAAKCPRTGDIVHAHSGRAHNTSVRATLGSRIKRVVTRHVTFAPRHPMIHRLKYTRTCDGIIAVSDAVRDVLLGAGIPAANVTVIHTGVAIPNTFARPAHAGLVVGQLGAFTEEKGHDVTIAAARLLPDVRFVLAGEGALREAIQQLAPANVEFPGFVDPTAFFQQLDMLVMPSRSEAWGLAALEAMAQGVPVIASAIAGLNEIVTPECGWTFPVGDAAALAAVIQGVHPDEKRDAAQARAKIFSIEKMAQQTEAFYASILD